MSYFESGTGDPQNDASHRYDPPLDGTPDYTDFVPPADGYPDAGIVPPYPDEDTVDLAAEVPGTYDYGVVESHTEDPMGLVDGVQEAVPPALHAYAPEMARTDEGMLQLTVSPQERATADLVRRAAHRGLYLVTEDSPSVSLFTNEPTHMADPRGIVHPRQYEGMELPQSPVAGLAGPEREKAVQRLGRELRLNIQDLRRRMSSSADPELASRPVAFTPPETAVIMTGILSMIVHSDAEFAGSTLGLEEATAARALWDSMAASSQRYDRERQQGSE